MTRLRTLNDKYRYKLLLIFILIYLIVPAFFSTEGLSNLLIIVSLSFIFLQSLSVFTDKKWHILLGYFAVATLLGVSWFSELINNSNLSIRLFQLSLYVLFFFFMMIALFRWLIKSKKVTGDSIIVAVAIYCLIGIIGGSLASLLNIVFPGEAYDIPESLNPGDLLDFTYYSFVTLTTLGYGDITPIRQESQVLGYLLAVVGQFYVAVVIAILVSQYISSNDRGRTAGKP